MNTLKQSQLPAPRSKMLCSENFGCNTSGMGARGSARQNGEKSPSIPRSANFAPTFNSKKGRKFKKFHLSIFLIFFFGDSFEKYHRASMR